MSSAVLAIDPGLTGAVALLIDGEYGHVRDLPVQAKRSGKRELDPGTLLDLLTELLDHAPDARVVGVIEQVAAMPGQGVSSMFSLGDTYGVCRAALTLHAHEMVYVSPAVWKRAFGLTKVKEYSLTLARRRFPAARDQLRRVKDHNRAEALLLAHYTALELEKEES